MKNQINKSNLMKAAHAIAKTLEGDYSARISLALTIAWKEARQQETVEYNLNWYRKTKTWLAKINGIGGKYGVKREFQDGELERTKNVGRLIFQLSDGVYEEQDYSKRRYFHVSNGQITYLSGLEAAKKLVA